MLVDVDVRGQESTRNNCRCLSPCGSSKQINFSLTRCILIINSVCCGQQINGQPLQDVTRIGEGNEKS